MGDLAVRRPIVRYFGGKWRIAPWIMGHFPPHRLYCEPFGGAASVLLRKPRSACEVYNDLDGEVVNLFRVLRDPKAAQQLCHLVTLTPFAREEFEQAYEPADDPIERARRLVIRGQMGYGSRGVSGKHRTGFRVWDCAGRSDLAYRGWDHFPETVAAVAQRFRGVIVEHKPAVDVIRRLDEPDALFYVDPPYVPETRAEWTSSQRCYRQDMTTAEHEELAAVLSQARGFVVLSGYRCELYDGLYAGWRTVSRGSRAGFDTPRVETLWLSPATAERLPMPLGLTD
ncbi:MAG: DNA adenine methylase [Thermoanaerobaculaceae bacterium]|jgi:DNA adenine methylase|nr:DNA adenine methylase [Thermoanaerobaculaceae bacterium]